MRKLLIGLMVMVMGLLFLGAGCYPIVTEEEEVAPTEEETVVEEEAVAEPAEEVVTEETVVDETTAEETATETVTE